MKLNNRVARKIVGQAVGGSLRNRLAPTPRSSASPALTRDEILDCLAAAYQNLGAQLLPTMNHLHGMHADMLKRELVTRTMLQTGFDALRTNGINPQDDTFNGFMRAAKL